jgi:hypothetical protein
VLSCSPVLFFHSTLCPCCVLCNALSKRNETLSKLLFHIQDASDFLKRLFDTPI